MPKPAKSQWDFGDLFEKAPAPEPAKPPEPKIEKPPAKNSRAPVNQAPEAAPPEVMQPPAREIWAVSKLTSKIRDLLETHLGSLWVTGEATNIRIQSSGHTYFTLKDAGAQLSCVLFRLEAPWFKREQLKEGLTLNLRGELSVYEARGQYQLIVTEVELQGQGALQAAFERLKAKLLAEGLFDSARKRQIPRYPQRIGVVTSPTGAALQDVLHVLRRRHPAIELILRPARVQGEGAAAEIAQGITQLNQFSDKQPKDKKLDCILVTRGGGSLEDLWAFNEEAVGRAIFNSTLPVISAVGHEIDFTISDFVADFRAATPSAAAEILTNGVVEARQTLGERHAQLRRIARQSLGRAQSNFAQASARLARMHPRRRLQEQAQLLDELQTQLGRCTRKQLRDLQLRAVELSSRLLRTRPSQVITRRRERLEQLRARFEEAFVESLAQRKDQLAQLETKLNLLSPKATLARGYSITLDASSGAVIRSAAGVAPGQKIRTLLAEGEVVSRVEKDQSGA